MKDYAPCLISVYNRPLHFRRCIESLAKCYGASSTPLFVAIDAPYREADKAANMATIRFAHEINGFKSIDLIIRERNVGAHNNIAMARNEIFRRYDRIVFSEDDNVFAPHFLEFVNQGLSLYENDPTIFSICGYSYPLDFSRCVSGDAFAMRAFSSWGVGYWKEKFLKLDYQSKDFLGNYLSLLKVRKLNKSVGSNIFPSLVASRMKNEIYGDTAITYHLYKNDMLCIFPKTSLVRNLGNDGSGLHSGKCKVYEEQEIDMRRTASPRLDIVRENQCARRLVNDYFRINPTTALYYYLTYCLLSVRARILKKKE